MQKKLYLSEHDKKIFGVCGGLAEYFEIDSTIIRLIWAISIFCFGFGVLPYIIMALIVPKDDNRNDRYYYDR